MLINQVEYNEWVNNRTVTYCSDLVGEHREVLQYSTIGPEVVTVGGGEEKVLYINQTLTGVITVGLLDVICSMDEPEILYKGSDQKEAINKYNEVLGASKKLPAVTQANVVLQAFQDKGESNGVWS